MPRIDVGDAKIKINEKGQKFLFVWFYLEYSLSLRFEVRLINAKICPLLTSKTQIKNSFVCLALQIAPFLAHLSRRLTR